MNEPDTLVLTETGVEYLPDGSMAVNVGPIVRALRFLTDGAGEDRGLDEQGNPLPDLMSLAFEVIESIIIGGRKADMFRQVKRELDAQSGVGARSSVVLATEARRVFPTPRATALDHAADELQALLVELRNLSLDEQAARELGAALESFRSFGADRWVSATAQLLLAAKALSAARPVAEPAPEPTKPKRKRKRKVVEPPVKQAKPKAKVKPKPSPKPKPLPKPKRKKKPKAAARSRRR